MTRTHRAVFVAVLCSASWAAMAVAAPANLTARERQMLNERRNPGDVSATAAPLHYVAPGVGVIERFESPPWIAGSGYKAVRQALLEARPGGNRTSALLVNGGFEDGTFNGWTVSGAAGTGAPSLCGQPLPADAFITNPGLQPYANNDPCVNFVYAQQHSAQLGDDLAWGFNPGTEPQCTSIEQTAVVAGANVAFTFAYAVVASNPGHGFGDDPYFEVKVEDVTAGMVLYDVIDYTTSYNPANPCNPWCLGGFDPQGAAPVVYRCWNPVVLNLVGIAGHTVRLSLIASDCSPSAHFCEAFLDGGAVQCLEQTPPDSVALVAACAPDPAAPNSFCATLHWDAPADPSLAPDSNNVCVPVVAPAANYDIRWSASPIVTPADFAAANQASGEPVPAAPGTPETFVLCGLPAGTVYFALQSADALFNLSALSTASARCIDNQPPDCSQAAATLAELWPPNHKMVAVGVTGITDPDGDAVTVAVTGVTQDEPLDALGDGDTCPDAALTATGASLRAERSGTGNGRVYVLSFTATDARGATCQGAVRVCVPHDQRPGHVCVDDGQTVNSLGPCGPAPAPRGGVSARFASPRSAIATIEYGLSAAQDVQVAVFDVAGRRVALLASGLQAAGRHQVNWDASRVPNGIYYVHVRMGGGVETRRLLVMH